MSSERHLLVKFGRAGAKLMGESLGKEVSLIVLKNDFGKSLAEDLRSFF